MLPVMGPQSLVEELMGEHMLNSGKSDMVNIYKN